MTDDLKFDCIDLIKISTNAYAMNIKWMSHECVRYDELLLVMGFFPKGVGEKNPFKGDYLILLC